MHRIHLAFCVLAWTLGLLPLSAAAQETLDLGNGVWIEVIRVEAGTFTQGSPPTEAGRGTDEAERKVTLTSGFSIGKRPVTRGQWERFVAETKFKTEAESGPSGGFGWDGSGDLKQKKEFTWRNPGFAQTADHPVCMVTFADAQAFCKWLARKSGKQVTLPTEGQWEYACRAGTTTAWHDGGDNADEVAWSKQTADNSTHPVTGKKANPWGLHIGGNVAEWCLDYYGPYPAGDATDPVQSAAPVGEKPRRVLRGGSWNRDAKNTRSAARFRVDPASRNADIGFRVVFLESPAGGADIPAFRDGPTPAVTTPAPPAAPAPSAVPASPPTAVDNSGLLPKSNAPAWFNCLTLACPFVGLAGLGYFLFRTLKKSAEAQNAKVMAAQQGMVSPALHRPGAVASVAPTPGISTTTDGFWLLLQDVAAGTLVEYGYTTDTGGETIDRVVYAPGPTGHFIYTGATPRQVRVTNVGGAGGTFSDDPTHWGSSPTPTRSHFTSSPSSTIRRDDSSRYPSAY